jgi:alpha-L-fucosidase
VNDRWTTGADLTRLLRLRPVSAAIDRVGRSVVARRGILAPKPPFFNFRTPEFTPAERIDRRPWEMTRGMDWGFGYNSASTEADYLSHTDLLRTLLGTVAHGGNLLLNLGPRGTDAQIPPEQCQRLDWLGAAWDELGEGILGSEPGSTAVEHKHDGETVYRWVNDDRAWTVTVGEGPRWTSTASPIR